MEGKLNNIDSDFIFFKNNGFVDGGEMFPDQVFTFIKEACDGDDIDYHAGCTLRTNYDYELANENGHATLKVFIDPYVTYACVVESG